MPESHKVETRELAVGEIIQIGDIYQPTPNEVYTPDRNGKVLGVKCIGLPVKKAGAWFRPQIGVESSDELTEEDVNMLAYFWNEKGDLERWCHWEDRKEIMEMHCPEILKAWHEYKLSRRVLTKLINNLEPSNEADDL